MENTTPLESLDQLVTDTLNSLNDNQNFLGRIEVDIIESKLYIAKEKVESFMQTQVYEMKKESHIQIFVKQCHSAIVGLLNEVHSKRNSFPDTNASMSHLYNELIVRLSGLVSFIESRFSNHISLLDKVPITYLIAAKQALLQHIESFRDKFTATVGIPEFSELVLNVFYDFTRSPSEGSAVTFKKVAYMKDLAVQLELLGYPEKPSCVFTALNELLVNYNFNSKSYINYFTSNVNAAIKSLTTFEERYNQLTFKMKEFEQMHEKPGVCYDLDYNGLKQEVKRWFTHELHYLEQNIKLSEKALPGPPEVEEPKKRENKKILCTLSGDQIGLFLRAIDQNKIVIAPSMSAVFNSIVPFLSTREREELSPDNTRAKSYSASDRDKEILITALEKLIRTINDF